MSSLIPSMHELLETSDGSVTVIDKTTGSTYHSRHGALTESQHVFIEKGLRRALEEERSVIAILEMGFGTGLNALLTEIELRSSGIASDYHALELNPLPETVWSSYRLPAAFASERSVFDKMHEVEWNSTIHIRDGFSLTKHQRSLLEFEPSVTFDLVYFDAFEPETQPELWTKEVFEQVLSWLHPRGILTTYCAKGYVRRNMLEAGFEVQKVPGPPGKREMIVAVKPFIVQ